MEQIQDRVLFSSQGTRLKNGDIAIVFYGKMENACSIVVPSGALKTIKITPHSGNLSL